MTRIPRYFIILLCLGFFTLLPGKAVRADDMQALPVTHGSIIRNDARITFEWPETVKFTAQADGKTLSITFARKANPDFGSLLSRLYPYVTSAGRSSDGRTIILTLDKPYRIRTFISDNIGGVDLLNIDPAKRIALHAQSFAALAPAAGGTQSDNKPASTLAEKPSPPSAAPAAATDSSALPPGEIKSTVNPSAPVKVSVSAETDNAVLRLPFVERMALGVFLRSNYLWVVCDKPVKLDLSDFDKLPQTVVGKAQVIHNAQATVLRIPVSNTVFVSVAKEEDSFEWAILLLPKKKPLAHPLKADINTDPPAPANVFIPVLEMGDPIIVQDPEIGDTMLVTPLFHAGEGLAATREFVEFSLLATAQGITVVKKADNVDVIPIREGLRISLPQGATLTPGLPDASSAASELLQSTATLFPYDVWKLDGPDAPHHEREAMEGLLQRIVGSSRSQDANEARLRLAQIYLSEGMAPEAMGLLDGIRRTNPVFYRSGRLAAMQGAANFLMYRFGDAARDFSAAELNNNKEVEYWRNMLSDLLGNPARYDFLALNDDYISKYPPLFRQRLAIVAADRSIDAKEYNTALKIFDSLKQAGLLEPIESYADFLLAKISADTGQEQEATDLWDKLAEDYKHPYVRARAEFLRIAWAMDHGTMTREQEIDRLERLRLSWHGDGLELQVLTLLGDLYAAKKDYVNAMRVWDDGVVCFPGTAAAIAMSHKMEETFVVMFNEGVADSMPTLDALALYYQYRNYTPAGTTGNEMMDKLADRLIAVDLLDQAGELLDHQMHFETEKEQRSRIGAKLATIQLLNHQPKKALEALEDSVYGENAVLLRLQRNRLTAQALEELGQPDKALQILGEDNTPEAERIRLDIYWQKKDWPRITSSVEDMLRARKDIAAPITIDESEALLKLALAYVFENNKVQLQYLHDYFEPLMAHNPNKKVFDFVTASEIPPNPTNFDQVIKQLDDTREFIDHYHAKVETASNGK